MALSTSLTKIDFSVVQTTDQTNFIGIVSASGFNIGSGVTINSSGLNVTGVVTATSFVGDGSGLSGVTTNYYKGEIFGYDNVLNSDITINSSYKTAVIHVDRDLSVDIENGVTVTIDNGCYLNIIS